MNIEKENTELKKISNILWFQVEHFDEDISIQVKFYVTEDDYDYIIAYTIWKPNNELNQEIILQLEENYAHDYVYTEYDCNGSSCVTFTQEFTEDKKFFRIRYSKHIDV